MRTALCILSEEKDIAKGHDLFALLDEDLFSDVFFLAKLDQTKRKFNAGTNRVNFIASDIRYSDEDFWAKIIGCLPSEIDQALAIPNIAFCTRRLLNLRLLLSDSVAAVFPVSTSHPASRAFLAPPKNIRLSPEQIEHWLNRFAVAKPLEIPVFAGSAAWINLKTLKKLSGGTDFEIAETARQSGHSLLVSDEAYVDDAACEPSGALPNSLAPAIKEALLTRHPYTAFRHPLSEVNDRGEHPPNELSHAPKVILHISHSWGGGLARWISDYAAADSNNVHLILKSIGDWDASGKSHRLFDSRDENYPLKSWLLTTPIVSSSTGSYEYGNILSEIIAHHAVSAIFVSTLIGHSLDVYATGLPSLHVLHDFYPWCPPLYATWETPCESCDSRRLMDCLDANPAHRFFTDQTPSNFLAFRAAFITTAASEDVALIAPTPSVKRRWLQLAGDLNPARISVIPHGLNKAMLTEFERNNWNTRTALKKIVVLGRLSAAKGEAILRSALPALLEKYEVVLLGCGDTAIAPQKHKNLNLVPDYDAHHLPQLLRELQPNCGLLLSTVPETFSYTLSELHAAGIPTIATHLGAFADRIEHGVNGWLIEPSTTALLELIAYLEATPDSLHSARMAILAAPQQSASDMVRAYTDLLPDRHTFRSKTAMTLIQTISDDRAEAMAGPVIGSAEHAYAQVLRSFLEYTENKLHHSTRVPTWLKYGGRQILHFGRWLLRKK